MKDSLANVCLLVALKCIVFLLPASIAASLLFLKEEPWYYKAITPILSIILALLFLALYIALR